MGAPLRIGVLASGQGTNLQALLDTVHGHEATVVAVASDKAAAPALERASAAGVATRVFGRDEFADRPARDAAIAAWLEEAGVELVVLAGYMAILDQGFIARFRDRIVNVHPSLLPAFGGTITAMQDALDEGVKVTGVTVHFVDEGVDTGPILLQEAADISAARDAGEVRAVLQPIEHRLLPEAVRLIAAGRVARDPRHPRRVVVG